MTNIFKKIAIYFFAYSKKCFEDNELANIRAKLKYCGQKVSIPYPFRIINPQYISIGNNFFSLQNLRIEVLDKYEGEHFTPKVTIGNNVVFNTDCHIGAINEITIGDNVLLASRVLIIDHSHGKLTADDIETPARSRKLFSKGAVRIGDNVWIGEGVAILPNVTIGKNAVIGSNSVVTSNIPENAIAAGIPARVIRIVE
jgi:acetyltransferase-like isoleucine patch superfamily enzyme